ncbi:MAG: sporulation transcriptional regulator SpoIIID [Bacilli bacterium]|nr:sporulation transcriptional regulator SpoIIID [Bacilli bacterium]
MLNRIRQRVIAEANYMVKTKKTIREISKHFNVSKSTVHDDLHNRLMSIDTNLYHEVNDILNYHYKVKHVRGGAATKLKYVKE